MNKIKFILPLAVLLALSVSFSSCNRDDENPLVGTTWVNEWVENGWFERLALRFTGETSGVMTDSWGYRDEVEGYENTPFTYTYSDSTVRITITEGGISITITGTIGGSRMTVATYDGYPMVFTRQ